MLIDELIEVTLHLSSIASASMEHRKFAGLFKLTSEELVVKVNKGNLEEVIAKFDKEESIKEKANLVRLWFNSGGNELTIINTGQDISKIKELEAKNIIFASLAVENQLEAYKKLSQDLLVDKNVYFTVKLGTNLKELPKGRNIFYFLENRPCVLFEYLAPYTKTRHYSKNNYETSNLQGTELKNLDFLLSNNVGALLYFEEFKENKYINMKDSAGFNLNLNFLKNDLKSEIQSSLLSALASNSVYNQDNIIRLENIMGMVADRYVDLGLINKFTTKSKPYIKQTQEDIRDNILRGLELTYWVQTEIEQVKITIKEEV